LGEQFIGRSLGLHFASAYAKASAGQAGEAGDDTPSLKSSYGEAGEGDSVRELEISVDQRLKSNPW